MRGRGSKGFTLIELLLAAAIFLAATGVVFHVAAIASRVGVAAPESADVNQRLRVAAGMIARDLSQAGSGGGDGRLGTLANYFPPIVPARLGALDADAEFSAHADRITIVYVAHGGASAELAVDMAGPGVDIALDSAAPGCRGAGICGFVEDTRAVIVNVSNLGAGYDTFTVTSAVAGLAHGAPNPAFSQSYTRDDSLVVPIVQRVYYLDRAARRLMVYDGFKSAFPLVDNVVDLEFAYFADPHPASVARPPDGAGSCVYSTDIPPVPLLPSLAPGTLVPVALTQLTDGPYCGVPPARFDADLLRIRRVRVRIRVQAALDQVRGRGADYANPGLADGGAGAVRDLELTFDVAVPNLQPAR